MVKFSILGNTVLVLLALSSASLIAAEPPTQAETTVVVASGLGTDPEKALKNALMSAVEQAVGLIVDAETLVKNDRIVRDQILTYSDGFVETFEKIREGTRDGLVEIKIKATIKRRQLVTKLSESKVTSAKLDGASLFGELTTQIEGQKNAAKLLERALEGLPLKLMTAELADPKPTIIKKDEASVKARWTVVIGFDQKAYDEKILPKLRDVLGAMAKRKGVDEVAIKANAFLRATVPTPIGKIQLWHHYNNLNDFKETIDQKSELFVALNVGRNHFADLTRWSWYVIDRASCAPVINAVLLRRYALRIAFIGDNDSAVRTSDIPLHDAIHVNEDAMDLDRNGTMPWFVRTSQISQGFIEIAPFVHTRQRTDATPGFFSEFELLYGDRLAANYDAEFGLDEIKAIREIRCSIVEMQPKK